MNLIDIMSWILISLLPLLMGIWLGYHSYDNHRDARYRRHTPFPLLPNFCAMLFFAGLAYHGIKHSCASGECAMIAIYLIGALAYPIGAMISIMLYPRIKAIEDPHPKGLRLVKHP
jgi:hypothetical protein